MRPEGPAFNRPGRKAGIEFIYVMSAEGAALQMHRKYNLFASGFVPHLRRFHEKVGRRQVKNMI
jgi:hypothetical protein